jgi:hypothetical protein
MAYSGELNTAYWPWITSLGRQVGLTQRASTSLASKHICAKKHHIWML